MLNLRRKHIAKPIFAIFFPMYDVDYKSIYEDIDKKLYDYHVLLFVHDKDEIEIKVFNLKDGDSMSIEDLKTNLQNTFNSLKKEKEDGK